MESTGFSTFLLVFLLYPEDAGKNEKNSQDGKEQSAMSTSL